jgi:two-component system nitrate/nitrite response regulator NarL
LCIDFAQRGNYLDERGIYVTLVSIQAAAADQPAATRPAALRPAAAAPAVRSAVTVLVAAMQPLWRDAIARVIRQDATLQLSGEEPDGRAALAAIRRDRPAVAVLDLPTGECGRLLRALRDDPAGTGVILLSEDLRPGIPYRALADGASGYLTRDATADQLRRAVVSVAAGGTVLAPPVQRAIAGEIRSRARDDRPVLSARERDVLVRVAEGRSTPDIAAELVLAPATIKTHLTHIYDKLEVSERAAAVAAAMRRGLLD